MIERDGMRVKKLGLDFARNLSKIIFNTEISVLVSFLSQATFLMRVRLCTKHKKTMFSINAENQCITSFLGQAAFLTRTKTVYTDFRTEKMIFFSYYEKTEGLFHDGPQNTLFFEGQTGGILKPKF